MIELFKRLFCSSQRPVAAFGRTDTGRVREHNEDSFSILDDRRMYLVADGMGGHNAGEIASRVAIESLVDFFSPSMVKRMDGNPQEARHGMISAFHAANKAVMAMAAKDKAMKGMGCTLVACHIHGGILHTCHVGDARCYIIDEKNIHQITTDHAGVTYSAEADEPGGAKQRHRNVITMAIGFPFHRDPEYHKNILKPGKKVLLCSDGLWSMIDDQEIHRIVTSSTSPERACEVLIRRANEAGGRDNITAIVLFA